jgi:hypothetical protein
VKKILTLLVALCACSVVNAQNISLELRDTPVRTALEMVFKQAGIKSYVIDNDVDGIIGTVNVTEQSVESALKLIMRTNSKLLTYVIENNVYIVKKRIINSTPPSSVPDVLTNNAPNNVSFERIPLIFIDPIDLISAFGNILYIEQFGRYKGGMNGMGASGNGGFGGAGSLGNGALGGNGGLGMGADNGMGGGAMGGLGGMMGSQGGMGGGMGGFGGGRNF